MREYTQSVLSKLDSVLMGVEYNAYHSDGEKGSALTIQTRRGTEMVPLAIITEHKGMEPFISLLRPDGDAMVAFAFTVNTSNALELLRIAAHSDYTEPLAAPTKGLRQAISQGEKVR